MNYVKVILFLALIAGGYWAYNHAYDSGVKDGKATVQIAWDADKEAIQKTAAAAVAQATKERDDALQSNEVIESDYQTKLLSANASASDFASRLRNAYASLATNRGAVPKSGGGQASPQASGSSGDDRLTGLLANAAAECLQNDDQLDALAAEVSPQQ
jgi:hypothetical protein